MTYAGSAYARAPYAADPGLIAGETSPPVVEPDTDVSNLYGVRWRHGTSAGTSITPVAQLPAGRTRGHRQAAAFAYPTPVIVDGRPT